MSSAFNSVDNPKNKKYGLEKNKINTAGIYISRDTLFSLDKRYKNEITVDLLKLNENNTVQVSFMKYSYLEGEDKMNNENITTWLNSESLYTYKIIDDSKIEISCYHKMPKRKWNDFATASTVKIKAKFEIFDNKLVQLSGSSKFKRVYILDKNMTNNHKNIKIGSACD
ncbi:hypothetical protein [Flavobacterium hungaricum]|uniref:hypothetical protein n=1 Tax=Flavobacterium hungaricum TaxID=2082725 RepID=UPI00187E25B6|nr:hypothetical protein [Flavobacterium hungaricum]